MRDFCEICQLNSPTGGCTRLSKESCLKEVFEHMLSKYATNGDVFRATYPNVYVHPITPGDTHVLVEYRINDRPYELKVDIVWWNSPYNRSI